MTRSGHVVTTARFAALASLAILVASAGEASAITRSETLVRAHAFAGHLWRSSTANQSASCATGPYQSLYPPGDYLGLPYDWGGYMSLFEFDQQIAAGLGAGSYKEDGVLGCTAGLDCSGFVSQAWSSSHVSTSTMNLITTVIAQADVLPGDVFNKAGEHVAMLEQIVASGAPVYLEAGGPNVHVNSYGGWSYVQGYTPRRYTKITGTTVVAGPGTLGDPIAVSSFPYSDTRSTQGALSDVLDGCGAAPDKDESGPEVIYRLSFSQPGTLTAVVSDDVGVDVDVHLYGSQNSGDCVARGDTQIVADVGCGEYLVVVDSFKGLAGAYSLMATFQPSGAACGAAAGPPSYAPKGKVGDPCSYPGHDGLGFCNPNLGGDVCLYGSSFSFCTRACETDADCAELAGGCCGELQPGEKYCFTQPLCQGGGGGVMSGPQDGGKAGDPIDPGETLDMGEQTPPVDEELPPGASMDGGCKLGGAGAPRPLWPSGLFLLVALFIMRRRAR